MPFRYVSQTPIKNCADENKSGINSFETDGC